MKRKSGILLPIFSLPGEYGCGTLGKSAYDWIDAISKGGFSYWQILPLGITDTYYSPYTSYSSFSGNPYFIDLYTLYEQGLLSKEELEAQRISDPYLCRFDLLSEHRYEILKAASMRVLDKEPIEAFMSANPDIAGTCEFLALKNLNKGKCWRDWTVKEADPDDLFAWQFIQYEFHRQWNDLHSYANRKGIEILGDIPFYVSYDSYDVYSAPDEFMLDKDGKPTCVAGVPPDYFSPDGQLWGNPIYNWENMKKNGYSRWKARLKYMLSLFDGVRIDHFRAISAYWSIPIDAKTAKEGRFEKGPANELIDAFREVSDGKLILAENLGVIDEDTENLLEYSTYPGMAVFQFGFDGSSDSPHLPHNYKNNLFAYTGTHDNNTLLGFLWELDDNTRNKVLDYLGNPSDAHSAIMRALLMSAAGTVIFPVQDILRYGADTRVNTPGKADGNWRYRVTKEQLDMIDWSSLARLNKMYSR